MAEDRIFPIIVKLLHIKFIFITDSTKKDAKPIYRRTIRRSGEEFDVYDSSIFYQFTRFSDEHRPRKHVWRFTSSSGQVDALQLNPFMPTTFDPDQAKKNIHNSVEGFLKPTPDTLLVTSHNYNGFQKPDGEWAGVRAANDTELLRLIVDFSSIMLEKGEDLFKEKPIAYWVHRTINEKGYAVKKTQEIEFEFNENRVYGVAKQFVEEGDVIKIEYKLNWDALINWQGYTRESEKVIPQVFDYKGAF